MHLLVGFSAGGPTDTLARLVGQKLSENWKRPVVVENKTGASGTIALDALARSAADGHTLGILNLNHVIAGEMLKNLSFSVEKDFAPIIALARQGNVLVVHPSVPAKNAAELIAYLKSRPGAVNFASGGNGSPAHVAGELFKLMAGVDMVHIPYKGAAPALQDVIAGRVSVMFAAAPPALPLVKDGRLRALAVTSNTRTPSMPDLPTLAESGINYDVRDWQGLVAPAATPKDLVARINADVREVLAMPEVKERIAGMGAELVGGTPAEFAAYIRRET
ncbi:MAG: tripartite tricarboxylate transporter substrate binding protein, partial [Betaproteobacteria bacterium]